jgi:DNA-binding transcriptional ArsR family regulator
MPGSRLTEQDRQHIASGLAEGLGYAEIARRLERPTSTVSREVTRNGGPDAYRADHAHLATERRAHRLPRSTAGPQPDAARDFEQQFTAMMVRTGLARMPARVLACVLTSDDSSLSAADLVQRLRVSPASVSKAVAYLEQLLLIRRERDASRRRERYVIDDDVWYLACRREVEVCATWAGAARHGAEILGDTPAGTRLDEMSRYFEHVGQDLARAAEHWRRVFTPRSDTAATSRQ